ncbi:hypothetical protein HWV62_39908 [Athelia sp. TMB]|nr:hypothetical protein HWV62_39908 [Athelia sp. TMB]
MSQPNASQSEVSSPTSERSQSHSPDPLLIQEPTPPRRGRPRGSGKSKPKAPVKTRSKKTVTSGKKPTGQSKKRKLEEIESEEEECSLSDLILFAPDAKRASQTRLELPYNTPFADLLYKIHRTIGCLDVNKKPELTYRLSCTPVKSPPCTLLNEDDWNGCKYDVNEHAKKKKGSATITILVSDNYLESLKARGKSNKAKAGSGKGKKKLRLMDLDKGSDDDDDEGEGDGLQDKENEQLEILENSLKRCQKCGVEKTCVINKGGIHCELTFQQLRAWTLALLSGQHGVTLTTPPTGDHFTEFHGKSKQNPAPARGQLPATNLDQSNHLQYHQQFQPHYYGQQYPPPYYPYPPAFQQAPPAPSTSEAPKHALPLSSPNKIDFPVAYPSIRYFLEDLTYQDSRRCLDKHCNDFDAENYYNIDEVILLGRSGLIEIIKMTSGNADYLLKAVRAEMKRVEQEARIRHNSRDED